MKKTKKQLLKLIEEWLSKFPCHLFLDTSFCCILEFISAEDMLKFIEKKYSQYKNKKTNI